VFARQDQDSKIKTEDQDTTQQQRTMSDSSIRSTFPIPVLTPIPSDAAGPTYATLRVMQTQLNSNAASVHSYGGDGLSGHLALTMPTTEYLVMTNGIVFDPPINPPQQPVHPVGATKHVIDEINRNHLVFQSIFRTYHETDKALRQQLLAAVPDEYVSELRHPTLGYGRVTCLELLTHLWATYGTITLAELEANRQNMRQPWSPPSSIEQLCQRLENGMLFATAGSNPISVSSAVSDGYYVLSQTGLFDRACRQWRDKSPADMTMAVFKTHFLKAEKDRREYGGNNDTTASAGYTSNQVVAQPPPTVNRTRGYCWTHGLMHNPRHTSATCKNKAEGHQDTATVDNKMGGKTTVFQSRSNS
jgi:hypothetical protein